MWELLMVLREVSRLELHSYYGNLNRAPYSPLFCSVFVLFCVGVFWSICVVSWVPRALPLMLVLLYLVVWTWFMHILHRLLSNLVFVSAIGIITRSQAISRVLALTLNKRLHRGLLKEDKRDKNVVLHFHLFSGIMRW